MQRLLDFYGKGLIGPIAARKIVPAVEVSNLLSCAQKTENMAKVVLIMPDQPECSPAEIFKDPLRFRSDRAYFMVGAYGRLSQAVTSWLVERGAQHVVLFCCSADNALYDDSFQVELKAMGCNTVRVIGDMTKYEDVVRAIRSSEIPFAGVLQFPRSSKVRASPLA